MHNDGKDQRAHEEVELPDYLLPPSNPRLKALFVTLCLLAFGKPNLEDAWKNDRADDHTFREFVGVLRDRLNSVNVVVSVPPLTYASEG